jgi:quinolinate synthase
MKRITLPKILHSLESMSVEVTVDAAIAARARASVERMLAVGARNFQRTAA